MEMNSKEEGKKMKMDDEEAGHWKGEEKKKRVVWVVLLM